MRFRSIFLSVALLGSLSVAGCCRDVERKLNRCREDAELAQAKAKAEQERLNKLLAGLRAKLADTEAKRKLLAKRLEALGQNVQALEQQRALTEEQKKQLAEQLARIREQMAELKRRQAQAEARARQFRQLLDKFAAMIRAGKVKVTIRDGRMVVALQEKILFDSGKAKLKPEGEAALATVTEVLKSIPNRKFQVAGHTDNVPIRTRRFKSNWELSVARALNVVKFMIKQGMPPERLSAAGYSQYSPVASNDTPEGRAENRRIEIVLQPNLAELPSLKGLVEESK